MTVSWIFPALLVLFLGNASAFAATIANGVLAEDFSTLDYADFSASTGVWNSAVGEARVAAHVLNTDTATYYPISFGDGSDGVLNSSAGYTFDTDAHPNGFNFVSVNISGGSITVHGSNPLVIRSLGAVSITPTLSVAGGAGQSATGAMATTGGQAVTCGANGGAGGAAGLPGGNGLESDGVTPDGGATGGLAVPAPGNNGGLPIMGPSSSVFETAANFICGAGGGGGGGDGSAGGAGGAGGGRVRIAAVGAVTTGTIDASGGNGGSGAGAANCGGNGTGGVGGAVWVQSLGIVSAAGVVVNGGNTATSNCDLVGGLGFPGLSRCDSSGAPGCNKNFDTSMVPASTQSVVQSKGYDLGVWNAAFSTAPTVTQVLNGGTIVTEYAGSQDNVTYSAFTTDLTTLSDQGYRYLKFRLTMTSVGAVGASPQVTGISIPYTDLGLKSLDVSLTPGCGTIQASKAKPDMKLGLATFSFWCALFLLSYLIIRKRYGSAGRW